MSGQDFRQPSSTPSLAERGQDISLAALRQGEHLVEELRDAARQRPYAIIAATTVAAIALGALWKLGHRNRTSRFQALSEQMNALSARAPSLHELARHLPRAWR